ncbi:phosphatidylglycerophosphate synthase, putative [Plasmodium gallinaceum]|uniref:CDP-diacylglycerol--glycerol-3-phosphate 3-phosphatidyltransferase n=1 Tax=Plasmodium gallinaceum TaxID=5849 RepID=A0A1J1GQV9_PLAGA|nr:phosphatidylglycerophosphate synthase, putative [Plasmodium gallinaceum]CRG93426.1 phosphatidylglycerophosphate synthase, putative [Plasmodium gallinaceum]
MTLKFIIHDPKAKLLFSPNEFYNTLNYMFKNSKNRIVISCLYLGIGELEKELVESIKKNINIRNAKVDILLDKQRGTRPEGKLKESSISVLSELFNYCNNININLFHNPLLGAILYNILPCRVNEIIGVMHMKVFIGDDTLLLSGANLSDSYLRNRQDRYFLIENKLLADSVHKIVNTIQKMSFTLDVDLTIKWNNDLMNPLIESHLFREQYYRRIQYVLNEIQNDISNYNKEHLNDNYNNTIINTKNSTNVKKRNTHYCNEIVNNGDKNINDSQKLDNEICEIKYGGIHGFISKLKQNIFCKEKNKKKMKNDFEKKNDLHKYSNEKFDFFYPLFEKNKSILIVELAMQCGFSIPPIYDESEMLENLLKNIKNYNQSLVISSGYLNFPQNFLKLFRNIFDNLISKNGKIQLVTASPSANSFYKSKGITYYVPSAYSAVAHLCIEFITKNVSSIFKNSNKKIDLQKKKNYDSNIYLEYHKPSWTFHSKGIWIINNVDKKNDTTDEDPGENNIDYNRNFKNNINTLENCDVDKKYVENKENDELNDINDHNYLSKCFNDLPWSIVIGSSNYGYRATYRDLEMSFVIKTNDYNLKRQFQEELNIIYESSKFVQMNELKLRCPKWLKLIVKYIVKWFL